MEVGRYRDIRRYDVLVKVSDDWYPNLPGDKVKVSVIDLSRILPYKKAIRICAWGGDDTGVEKDFEFETDEDRDMIFETLVGLADLYKMDEPINREMFVREGFLPA